MSKKLILIILSIAFVGLASSQTFMSERQKTAIQKDTVKKNKTVLEEQEVFSDSLLLETGKFKRYKKDAHASYYADRFHGKRTASGIKYNKNAFTAAHKKLPFGTKVKITNEANGKSVIVEITDRGPFVKSREIDLSRRAYMQIASNRSSGNMLVTMEVLQK
jgi:rare lipoprotein A